LNFPDRTRYRPDLGSWKEAGTAVRQHVPHDGAEVPIGESGDGDRLCLPRNLDELFEDNLRAGRHSASRLMA
jgi:hypothetical protein